MIRRRARRVAGVVLAVAWVLGLATFPAIAQDKKPKPPAEDAEVVLGRKNAEENDKQVKLITDPAIVGRVTRLGQEIAAVANTLQVPATWGTPDVKKFEYTFKVVDDKDVNAYSLPGGHIYVNKGLLDYVHSDDELAGVLAHEVAHAAHHHMMKLIKEQERIQQRALLPLLLIVILGRGNADSIQGAFLAGQLYMVAKLNSYGVEAEKDADQAAVRYLVKTNHSPVGMLTFMERLAFDEVRKPQVELGIFRTHPPSPERAAALKAELDGMGIAINRREVDPAIRADVATRTVNGITVADVSVSKVLVGSVVAGDGLTAEDRARRFAQRLNVLMDKGLALYDVRIAGDGTRVIVSNEVVVSYTQADGDAIKKTPAQMATDTRDVIRNLIWQDQFSRPHVDVGAGG